MWAVTKRHHDNDEAGKDRDKRPSIEEGIQRNADAPAMDVSIIFGEEPVE